MAAEAKSGWLRIAQGLALATGAVALEVLVARGSTPFYWTPLIIGLAYLAAAAFGGRTGGHWPTATVLCGWGLAVVIAGSARPDLDTAGLYLAGAGVGASVGVVLSRAGFEFEPLGATVTVAAAGFVLALAPRVDALVDAQTFAILLGLVALVNLLLGVRAQRAESASGGAAPAS